MLTPITDDELDAMTEDELLAKMEENEALLKTIMARGKENDNANDDDQPATKPTRQRDDDDDWCHVPYKCPGCPHCWQEAAEEADEEEQQQPASSTRNIASKRAKTDVVNSPPTGDSTSPP